MAARIAYQGEPGAYSEAATYELCGRNVSPVPFDSFERCFQALSEGSVDFAMMPIENNRGGTVIDNHDLQLRYPATICAELNFRVRHCLLVPVGTEMSAVNTVISHPQALAQCDGFLRRHGLKGRKEYDTAGSAKKIRDENLVGFAAIASRLAAEHYGLEILEEGIEDDSSNTTRFLLLTKKSMLALPSAMAMDVDPKLIRQDMKTSMVFSLEDVTGSLFRALAAFSLRDVFMTKLESRPDTFRKTGHFLMKEMEESALYGALPAHPELKAKDFSVVFYVDVIGSVLDVPVVNAIKHLAEAAPFLRILGCYPRLGKLTSALSESLQIEPDASRKLTRSEGSKSTKLKIGIVGFGNFGQFLAKTFVKHAKVSASNRTDYSAVAEKLGVAYYNSVEEMVKGEGGVDVLVVSVAILAFEKVVNALPMGLLDGVLVVDVLSVKVFPKLKLLEKLPTGAGILCTHPMFGPESGKYSWKGLPMVHDKVRVEGDAMEEVSVRFLKIFVAEGCFMVDMDCETHDRQAADSQFITHFIGRMIAKLNLSPTGIATKGFEALLALRDNTMKDSFALFSALYMYNLNASASLANIKDAVEDLAAQLRDGEHADVSNLAPNESDRKDLRLSAFINSAKPSKTGEVFGRASEMRRNNIDVAMSLAVGEPDFSPPQIVLDAATQAVNGGETRYTPVPGTFELREAISKDLEKRKNMKVDPATEVLVTPGGKQAIFAAILSLCDEGDEVVVPAPYWVSYPEIVRLSRAEPVILQTEPKNAYVVTPIQLSAVLSPKTRMIILCNPSNPTGALMEKHHLEALATVLRRPEYSHIYVLADEIYERLTYDGKSHTSFAALEGMAHRTLTVNGFSKAYAMTGFRLGYIVGPRGIINACKKLQSQLNSSPCSISQRAGVVALTVPDDVLKPLYDGLDEKRQYVLKRLNAIPNVVSPSVSGAFYAFPDVSAYFGSNVKTKAGVPILNTTDLCKYLLEEHLLALPPGDAFGGPYGIRLSYATSMEELEKAIDRLEQGLGALVIS